MGVRRINSAVVRITLVCPKSELHFLTHLVREKTEDPRTVQPRLFERFFGMFVFDIDIATNCMEWRSSSEANRSSASQWIPHILWNPKVFYRIRKPTSPISILSQLNPVHASTSNFLKIRFNIILPSTPRSSKYMFPLKLYGFWVSSVCLLYFQIFRIVC